MAWIVARAHDRTNARPQYYALLVAEWHCHQLWRPCRWHEPRLSFLRHIRWKLRLWPHGQRKVAILVRMRRLICAWSHPATRYVTATHTERGTGWYSMSCCRSVGALATSNQFYSSGPLSGCGQVPELACCMQGCCCGCAVVLGTPAALTCIVTQWHFWCMQCFQVECLSTVDESKGTCNSGGQLSDLASCAHCQITKFALRYY